MERNRVKHRTKAISEKTLSHHFPFTLIFPPSCSCCPPINTPLPPDRVTDHFSVLYIPPQTAAMIHPAPSLLPQLPPVTRLTPTCRLIFYGISNASKWFCFFCLLFLIDCCLKMQKKNKKQKNRQTKAFAKTHLSKEFSSLYKYLYKKISSSKENMIYSTTYC